jgi:nicotinic acid mononucleotide adenylyltransferase
LIPCLEKLTELLKTSQVQPWRPVRLSPYEPEQPRPDERPLRLGLFPTAANPLHWMHIMAGLLAISRFRLDKVIYLIAGSDSRKTNLLPAATRHLLAARVLKAFSPFLTSTPISLESSLPGEVNVFKLLQLNAQQSIRAFYMAGTDHCRRIDPVTGEPDTLQRLEDGVRGRLYGFDERRHSLAVVFLDRGGPVCTAETFLEVHRIDRLPMNVSSTRIRNAFCGRCPPEALAGIPFTIFAAVRALELYGSSFRPNEEETPVVTHDISYGRKLCQVSVR